MKRKQMYKRIAAVFVSAAMLMGSMSMAYAEEPGDGGSNGDRGYFIRGDLRGADRRKCSFRCRTHPSDDGGRGCAGCRGAAAVPVS